MKIYNVLGKIIKVLRNENLKPGYHLSYWDSSNQNGIPAASGIYYVVLKTGAGSLIRKIAFLKQVFLLILIKVLNALLI